MSVYCKPSMASLSDSFSVLLLCSYYLLSYSPKLVEKLSEK
jgi:hypothetical protein